MFLWISGTSTGDEGMFNCTQRTQLQTSYWKELLDSASSKVSEVSNERDVLLKEKSSWEEERKILEAQLVHACFMANNVVIERDKLVNEKRAWEDERKNLRKHIEVINLQIANITKEKERLLSEKSVWEEEKAQNKKQIDSTHTEAMNDTKKILSKYFTPCQIDAMLSDTPVKQWQDEDICRAITLQSLSPKGYRYLRESMKLPFPSKSTLNRWASKLYVEPGVMPSVLQLLHHKAESMTELERICVLSFDETSVAYEWSYDKATDTLYDPKERLQCAMIRGLVSPWKQLIYYDFDTAMSEDILHDIIVKVEAAGFIIVAMVNDLGPTNLGLWKSLNVSIHKSYFTNPAASDRKIFAFADAPHLIKLIRNNFLDYGFKLEDNNINSECVRELVRRSVHDLKTTHRLTHKHIDVTGVKRMNVRLAVQVLSESTSKSLKFFGEQGLLKSRDWECTSHFIGLSDSWYDLFNSKRPRDRKKSRDAYGLHLDAQKKVLEEMINVANSMRVQGRNKSSLFQFQKGLIVSSQSLLGLYDMLKDKYGINYILTYRLNQDIIEHFFGCLRQMGVCHQHPSPVDVKYRIRKYLLGKNTDLMGGNYNTERHNDDTSMSQAYFSESSGHQSETTHHGNTEELDKELLLSAMLFSSLDWQSPINEGNENVDPEEYHVQGTTLEVEMETEGLRYLGGFIVSKFPQYKFLGSHAPENDNTWIGAVSRVKTKLMSPSTLFFEQLKYMENLFMCYHGNNDLRSGKKSIKTLANMISEYVALPSEVVTYFVRCRMFFRIRILNRKISKSSTKVGVSKKMAKLVK